MRIDIISVQDSGAASGARIRFRSACGEAEGRWVGAPPGVGDLRFVELDSTEVLRPGENVEACPTSEPAIYGAGAQVDLVAQLLAVYPEGTLSLRLGDGRLTLEYRAEPDFWKEGRWYRISLQEIVLYDMDL